MPCEFLDRIDLLRRHTSFVMVRVQEFRHAATKMGLVKALFFKTDRCRLYRLLGEPAHDGDDTGGVESAREKRSYRYVAYQPKLYRSFELVQQDLAPMFFGAGVVRSKAEVPILDFFDVPIANPQIVSRPNLADSTIY